MSKNTKYVLHEYYWLMNEGIENKILSQCVQIINEVPYFQIIGLSVLYTEKDFGFLQKAVVR